MKLKRSKSTVDIINCRSLSRIAINQNDIMDNVVLERKQQLLNSTVKEMMKSYISQMS